MMLLTVHEPVVVHPEWSRLLRALHEAGVALEIHEKQLRARLDYHASGPPKSGAVSMMLDRYYAGDGDPERGRRRRDNEIHARELCEPLRRVA